MNALASRPICCPVAHHMLRLKLMAVVMGKAKLVSYLVPRDGVFDTCEMPCVASDHQLYALRPSELSGDSLVSRASIFSAMLRRDIMSLTRASIGSSALHQGCFDCADELSAHGLFRRGGDAGCGTGSPLHDTSNTPMRHSPPQASLLLPLHFVPQSLSFAGAAPSTAFPHMHCSPFSTPARGIFASEHTWAQYSCVSIPSYVGPPRIRLSVST